MGSRAEDALRGNSSTDEKDTAPTEGGEADAASGKAGRGIPPSRTGDRHRAVDRVEARGGARRRSTDQRRREQSWRLLFLALAEPMSFKPSDFSGQGNTASRKRTQQRSRNRTQIGDPLAVLIWLDVRSPANRNWTESRQIERFVIDAMGMPRGLDDEFHRYLTWLGE